MQYRRHWTGHQWRILPPLTVARKNNVVKTTNKTTAVYNIHKNSSGDEIANVNFFTTISHTNFKTPKREPISFNKLDNS